jgi:hypothetical protein
MGSEINKKSNDSYLSKLRLEKIGFVFQTFNLLATMTAYENVELPMKLLGKLTSKQIKQRTLELLGKVGLQDRVEHLVNFCLMILFFSHLSYLEVNNKELPSQEPYLTLLKSFCSMNQPVISILALLVN